MPSKKNLVLSERKKKLQRAASPLPVITITTTTSPGGRCRSEVFLVSIWAIPDSLPNWPSEFPVSLLCLFSELTNQKRKWFCSRVLHKMQQLAAEFYRIWLMSNNYKYLVTLIWISKPFYKTCNIYCPRLDCPDLYLLSTFFVITIIKIHKFSARLWCLDKNRESP